MQVMIGNESHECFEARQWFKDHENQAAPGEIQPFNTGDAELVETLYQLSVKAVYVSEVVTHEDHDVSSTLIIDAPTISPELLVCLMNCGYNEFSRLDNGMFRIWWD